MAALRDEATDSGRLGQGRPLTGDKLNVQQDFGPTSIAEQNMLGGYNKTDVPAGGMPPRARMTTGSAEG